MLVFWLVKSCGLTCRHPRVHTHRAEQWYSTGGTRTPGGTRRHLRGYVDFTICITCIMYQQLWGYKVEEKLYLVVREQKRLNTTGTENPRSHSVKFELNEAEFYIHQFIRESYLLLQSFHFPQNKSKFEDMLVFTCFSRTIIDSRTPYRPVHDFQSVSHSFPRT
jgi:hypothetical protein